MQRVPLLVTSIYREFIMFTYNHKSHTFLRKAHEILYQGHAYPYTDIYEILHNACVCVFS